MGVKLQHITILAAMILMLAVIYSLRLPKLVEHDEIEYGVMVDSPTPNKMDPFTVTAYIRNNRSETVRVAPFTYQFDVSRIGAIQHPVGHGITQKEELRLAPNETVVLHQETLQPEDEGTYLILVFEQETTLNVEKQETAALSLWEMEPKILLDEPSPPLWWFRGSEKTASNQTYQGATDRLIDAFNAGDEVIAENYCMVYVNSRNNTVFVVVKSLSPDILERFVDVMKPDPGVSILFRKGYASFAELEEWENIIRDEIEYIESRGVKMVSFGKSVNATITIQVVDITMEQVNHILEALEGKVPPGVLVFEPGAQAEIV
jgi:hypothetical protein